MQCMQQLIFHLITQLKSHNLIFLTSSLRLSMEMFHHRAQSLITISRKLATTRILPAATSSTQLAELIQQQNNMVARALAVMAWQDRPLSPSFKEWCMVGLAHKELCWLAILEKILKYPWSLFCHKMVDFKKSRLSLRFRALLIQVERQYKVVRWRTKMYLLLDPLLRWSTKIHTRPRNHRIFLERVIALCQSLLKRRWSIQNLLVASWKIWDSEPLSA